MLVREAGLEPARPEWTLEPESSESANSTTRAFESFVIIAPPPFVVKKKIAPRAAAAQKRSAGRDVRGLLAPGGGAAGASFSLFASSRRKCYSVLRKG